MTSIAAAAAAAVAIDTKCRDNCSKAAVDTVVATAPVGAPPPPTTVVILYEQDLDKNTKKQIVSVLPSVCDLDVFHLEQKLDALLNAYDVILIDMKVKELRQYWIAQRVYIPESCTVLFYKNHGNTVRNTQHIKDQLYADFVIKTISIPSDHTLASFITANSADYVCQSDVFQDGFWKRLLKGLFSFLVSSAKK